MFYNLLKSISFVLFGILVLSAVPVQAQDWKFSTVIYLWGAGMDGETGSNDQIVEVDQSFGDILSNLELGFMGGLQARSETWVVTADFIYMGLGADGEGPLGNSVEVDVDQTMFGADVGYAVSETTDLFVGGRIVSIGTALNFSGPLNLEIEDDRTWFDPFFGIRYSPWLSENWSLLTRFDIGGFDIGSDIVWQLNADAVWHISDRSSLAFGYRIMSMKYDDEEGENEFVYDMTTHGPIGGFIYSF